jgi:hypothetical protein
MRFRCRTAYRLASWLRGNTPAETSPSTPGWQTPTDCHRCLACATTLTPSPRRTVPARTPRPDQRLRPKPAGALKRRKKRENIARGPPYALRAAITTRAGLPDSPGSPARAGVAGSRLSPWEESFFCRTGPTLSTGSDVQFVRVLPSKFAAGISVGDEEIQRRERRWIRFTIYWEPFRTMMPKV